MTRNPANKAPIGRIVGAAFAALFASGCADMLPDPNQIIRTRVLAVRTSVTQPLVADQEPTTRAQAIPFEGVTIEPFIVGPDGPIDPDTLDPVWLACELPPGAGLLTCLQDAMPLALADIPACPLPDLGDLMGEDLPETPSPCVIDRAGSPTYTVPLSINTFVGGSVELTMIAGDDGTSTDACARPFLDGDYELPNECLYVVQRLTIGPAEYFAFVVSGFGFEIPGLEAPDDPADVPQPDRNPRITRFEAAVLDDDGEPGPATVLGQGDVVELDLEQTLRIDVTQPEADLQSFEVSVNNGESTETETEKYSAQWYRSWGRLLSSTSNDPESYNEWTFVEDVQDETSEPEDDRAFMYYVVRDGRQGVAWWWFEARRP